MVTLCNIRIMIALVICEDAASWFRFRIVQPRSRAVIPDAQFRRRLTGSLDSWRHRVHLTETNKHTYFLENVALTRENPNNMNCNKTETCKTDGENRFLGKTDGNFRTSLLLCPSPVGNRYYLRVFPFAGKSRKRNRRRMWPQTAPHYLFYDRTFQIAIVSV